MKKAVPVIALVVILICAAVVVINSNSAQYKQFIRLHILANSNSAVCQRVKYRVRGSVVTALSAAAAEAGAHGGGFYRMHAFLHENLALVEQTANSRLIAENVPYRAAAEFTRRQFPARSYNGVLLPAGEYYALILKLGRAEGNNWWCVIYPQLCFVPAHEADSGDIVYASLFLQLMRQRRVSVTLDPLLAVLE